MPLPDFGGAILERRNLTGDWDGARDRLAEVGLQLELQWTHFLPSLIEGGRSSGSEYAGHLAYDVKLDLMRMDLVPGGLIHIRGESRYGTTINRFAGPILPANLGGMVPVSDEMDQDIALAITNLSYTQFIAEWLAVTAGKIDTFDADPNEFASGRGVTQFQNFNFNFAAPVGLYPYSTLAAGVLVKPAEELTVTSIVAGFEDSSTSSGFDELGDWFWSVEADTRYRLGGLPGGANAGAMYAWSHDFIELGGPFIFVPGEGLQPSMKDTSWVAFASLWQYLWVEGDVTEPVDPANGIPDYQGFGVFSRIAFADEDTNPAKFTASGGIGGRGIIPTRDDDVFGVGYFYIDLSTARLAEALRISESSQGFEAFYNISVARSLMGTVDFQVLDAPLPDVNTSYVLAVRLSAAL